MITGVQILNFVGICLLSAVPLTWLYFTYRKLSKASQYQAFEKFELILNSLKSPRADYKFYSTGHPYTWTEISEDEALDMVKWSAIGLYGMPIPPQLLLHVSEDKKAVYIITHQRKFDWKSLVHYEDWIRKDKDNGAT